MRGPTPWIGLARKITQAAIELHGSVGPAATTISAVAQRAGVTRATLYRHFPNEETLFKACSAEWRSANPAPNPGSMGRDFRSARSAATALLTLYGWYRSPRRCGPISCGISL